MLGMAGTPVIDSPSAWVTISLPSTVTRTIAALRWACAIVSPTILITARALAGFAEAPHHGAAGALPFGEQASAATARRHTTEPRCREMVMTDPDLMFRHSRGCGGPAAR